MLKNMSCSYIAISDDSFKLELDCPHRQSSLKIPNPVVRFEDLTEDDREDLFAQMDELTKEIIIKFKKLLKQVFRSLTDRVQYTDVVVTLTGDDTMMFDDDDELDKAKDMFEVFKAIRPHYSYFNYDLLKQLIDVHGTSEDKKCLYEYLQSFASYCQAMPCAEEICGSDDSRPNRTKIRFKLNFDRQRLKADCVKDIIRNIARILKIKPSSLYLYSIKEGCVSLEFLVPSFLYERIFPLTDDQVISLYSELKVTAIQCDRRSLRVDVETDAKHNMEAFGSADTGSTTNSESSPIVDFPERFDFNSFSVKLSEVKRTDPQWNQLEEVYQHHGIEEHRLGEEVKRLEDQKNGKEYVELKLKLKTLERELALTKQRKALSQQRRRASELERDLLSQELKMAANDVIKIEIQRQLERAEESIREIEEEVKECEHEVNRYEENLVQLRKGHQATSGYSSGALSSSGYSSGLCSSGASSSGHSISSSSSSGYSSGALSSGFSSGASSSGYSSGASPKGYSLIKRSKSHSSAEYQKKRRSFVLRSLRQYDKIDERRAMSDVLPMGVHVGSTDTTSSGASSGYFSNRSFYNKLLEVKLNDPQWKQFDKEFHHHGIEEHRLGEEVEQLEHQKSDKEDIELKLKLKKLEKELADTKRLKAGFQQWQRGNELERDLILQELKTANDDDVKIEIQDQLERAENEICARKEMINECERQVYKYEESLAQLRKESHPPGSADPHIPAEDEGISLSKTVPAISITSPPGPASSSSPATTHYTCPSCGRKYQGDKGLTSREEKCTSCSGSDGGKLQTGV